MAGLLLVTAAQTGCAPPGEDVRVSFCKAVVQAQVGGTLRWLAVSTQPRRYAGLTVTLGFEAPVPAGAREATCHYRYDAVDDTAQALADPLSVYATSPESVTIDGQVLSRAALAEAVKRASLRQGRDLINRVQGGG